jgi:hypothetical protein
MGLVDRARVWWWRQRPRRRGREQELRRNYQALLHERARSLEERLQFHLDHLEEYWDRCLGFLALRPDHNPTFVAGDLAVCIYIASDAATADVRAYCSAHGASELDAAWMQYAQSLTAMSRADPTVSVAIRRSADEFRRVRAAHGQAPHVAV